MRRAIDHRPAGNWPEFEAHDAVTLDFQGRHRRRIKVRTDEGNEILLDLPAAVAMAGGDGLRLDDESWIAVRAAAEPVVDISCAAPALLARIAWHLGNRHLSVQIGDGFLRIRPDHVIEEMVVGLGGGVRRHSAPFQPEGGAYAAPVQGHGHDHDHEHDFGHRGGRHDR